MCHVSNMVLAAGLLSGNARLVQLGAIWIIPGIPLWLMDMVQTSLIYFASVASHLGGLAVAILALRWHGMKKNTWFLAVIWFLLVQQLCRVVAPVELNVNLAHNIWPGSEQWFSDYRVYWAFTTGVAAVCLWLCEQAIIRLLPRFSNITGGMAGDRIG